MELHYVHMSVLVGKTVSDSSRVESEKTEPPDTSTTLALELTPVSSSQSNTASVTIQSTVAQPPPPLSILPADPASITHFPPCLPAPPVEHLPVQFPPDVRWQFGSTIQHNSARFFPQPFHRPPVVLHAVPQLFSYSVQPAPPTQRSQTRSHSDTAPPQTCKVSSLSSSIVSTVSQMVSSSASVAESSNKPIIKDYVVKGATPRFIPRQLCTAGANSDKVQQNPDPVIEELKQNAFVLSSKVQGPSLPSQIERKRKEFKSSETGSESLDRTVKAIRHKVSHVSANVEFC